MKTSINSIQAKGHYFTIILLFLSLTVGLGQANYFKIKTINSGDTEGIISLQNMNKNFIVHWKEKIYSLKSISVDSNEINGTLEIPDYPIYYEDGRKSRYRPYKEKNIILEVHIYLYKTATNLQLGQANIPVSAVQEIRIIEPDFSSYSQTNYLQSNVEYKSKLFCVKYKGYHDHIKSDKIKIRGDSILLYSKKLKMYRFKIEHSVSLDKVKFVKADVEKTSPKWAFIGGGICFVSTSVLIGIANYNGILTPSSPISSNQWNTILISSVGGVLFGVFIDVAFPQYIKFYVREGRPAMLSLSVGQIESSLGENMEIGLRYTF